jgi:hypothetical protein
MGVPVNQKNAQPTRPTSAIAHDGSPSPPSVEAAEPFRGGALRQAQGLEQAKRVETAGGGRGKGRASACALLRSPFYAVGAAAEPSRGGAGPATAGERGEPVQGRCRVVHSLAPTSPDLAEASYSIRPWPPSASRQNASKNGRIALIYLDWGSGPRAVGAAATVQGRCRVVHSLAPMSPALAEASYSSRPWPPSASRQNAAKNARIALIYFDWGSGPHAVGAAAEPSRGGAGPATAGERGEPVQGRCRVVHSLAPMSPDLIEAGYGIRSRRPSPSRQNAAKNAQIALIYFDWGSSPYAVGAAATVQGRYRVVHSLAFAPLPTLSARCPSASEFEAFGLIHFDSVGFTQRQGHLPIKECKGLKNPDSSAPPPSKSPGLAEAGYRIRSRPWSASRQNAPNNGWIALIYFDWVGFAPSERACSRIFMQRRFATQRAQPEARLPNSIENGLIYFDSVGFLHPDSSPSRHSGTCQINSLVFFVFFAAKDSNENGLIYFDWVGFAPSERSRARIFEQRRLATRSAQPEARLPISIENALIRFDSLNAQRGSAPWIVANAQRESASPCAERRLHRRRSFNRSLHGGRSLKFTMIRPTALDNPEASRVSLSDFIKSL